MIGTSILFTEEQACRFFRAHGLTVTKQTVKVTKPAYHNRTETHEEETLVVINPHNGQPEPLKDAFIKVLEYRKQELFLDDVSKFTVLETMKVQPTK
jgi:hypothetical protein